MVMDLFWFTVSVIIRYLVGNLWLINIGDSEFLVYFICTFFFFPSGYFLVFLSVCCVSCFCFVVSVSPCVLSSFTFSSFPAFSKCETSVL